MCVSWSGGGLLLLISQAKGHPKAEKQNKPIHGTKNFKGRVAPPLVGCVFRGLPHIKFFFNFFCSNSFYKFFSDFVLYVKFCKVVFYCL